MFYTPKPRQFHYRPRFYDPEKERWEALKQKYADERLRKELLEAENSMERGVESGEWNAVNGDAELEYFQRRVQEIDKEEKSKSHKLTWKDLVRKREMPKFNYQPRFGTENGEPGKESGEMGTGEHIAQFKRSRMSIKRRFDITDEDYMKPIPAGRIMLYALLVCMLLYWILF
ncbi:MAG: hypothetical protein IKP21_06260 [Bacteroidales bacterium]|nr:hypothetical protein [Bacteroidales bacterium]